MTTQHFIFITSSRLKTVILYNTKIIQTELKGSSFEYDK